MIKDDNFSSTSLFLYESLYLRVVFLSDSLFVVSSKGFQGFLCDRRVLNISESVDVDVIFATVGSSVDDLNWIFEVGVVKRVKSIGWGASNIRIAFVCAPWLEEGHATFNGGHDEQKERVYFSKQID